MCFELGIGATSVFYLGNDDGGGGTLVQVYLFIYLTGKLLEGGGGGEGLALSQV